MGKIPVAIQLYSVRDAMNADIPGTLRALADMGYEGVEFAGYGDRSGPELKALLDECGLRCAGSHLGMPKLEGDEFEKSVEINRALDNRRLIIPSADMGRLDESIARMNAINARARECGMKAGYHNHVREFETTAGGPTCLERIFGETPEDFLVQVDIGWAAAAGQDVAALLRRYANRIETVHIKEHDPDNPAAVVGAGTVDWPTVMTLLERETRVEWYVVEQERHTVGPLESARGCIENIRAMGR